MSVVQRKSFSAHTQYEMPSLKVDPFARRCQAASVANASNLRNAEIPGIYFVIWKSG